MEWRTRTGFWAFTAAVLTLVSVPSADWLAALRSYARLAGAWEPAPLKPAPGQYAPHESRGPADAAVLHPVQFRHKPKKAKSVELVGDFNAWRPGLLRMKKGGDGAWTLVVPLASGRHKYLYLVDGEPQVDAAAPTDDGPEGRRVSVKVVR